MPGRNARYPVVYFNPVHPSDEVDLTASPELLATARRTVREVNALNAWSPTNGLCLAWPPAARVVAPTGAARLLDEFERAVNLTMMPNFVPFLWNRPGSGSGCTTEQAGATARVVVCLGPGAGSNAGRLTAQAVEGTGVRTLLVAPATARAAGAATFASAPGKDAEGAEGDVLVVGVNVDAQVQALKGERRPVYALAQRLEILAELQCVDLLIPFEERTADALIERVRPDVFVKGGDYTPETILERETLERVGAELRLLQHRPGLSSTDTIERLGEG